MHTSQTSWKNPVSNVIVALPPNEERATTIMIPILGEEEASGPLATQRNQTRDPQSERSYAGIFLLLVGVVAMFGMWSLFGGEPSAEPTPAIVSAVLPAGPSDDAQLAQVTIEVEPSTAKIQAAAVSLGATVTQTGTLTAELPAGESLALTVSLDGYRTVQQSITTTSGLRVLRLVLEERPASEVAPSAINVSPRAPAQQKRAPKLTPPTPSDCLD